MSYRAKKRFGQNFLVDQRVIDRCIASIAPIAGELIFEIGPGQGALTGPLSTSGVDLILVEIDRDLADRLAAGKPDYLVINQDALEIEFAAHTRDRPYRLVGNLPYNISTPLLFHCLAQHPAATDMHFMLQKEVVRRMQAGPGGKEYGRLSLMCQNLCEVIPLFEAGPRSFHPAPKVDSAFVRLVPRSAPLVEPALSQAFDKVVRQAFSMRRKTLRNCLRPLLDAQAIQAVGIDPGNRAEQLSIEEFAALAGQLPDQES